MGKRDKNKMRHEEDVFWGHDGTYIDIEGTQDIRQREMEERGEKPVSYAPCPNPDAKWKALLAVCTMPGWNGTMKGVMACLIQCANYYSGKCCPSEEWMAEKLECDPSTVKRAVARLKSKYLSVQHRNEPTDSEWKSNAYVVGWAALINRCHAVFPWTNQKHRGATLHEQGGNVAQTGGQECPVKYRTKNIEEKYEPKRVHSPSASCTNSVNLFLESQTREKGIQKKGEVERPSPPLGGPSSGDVQETVSRYCQPFHWAHLGPEDFEAAVVAELGEAGLGRAVVQDLARNVQKRKEPPMDNVITFPSCLWDGGMWWHAGKSYVHLGKLKELCTTAEWRRIYDYDLRRHLREQLRESRSGGNAA